MCRYDEPINSIWLMAKRYINVGREPKERDQKLVNPVDLESSVPDRLIEHPELLAIFQELGIDYSCGGKSLARACEERNLSMGNVLLRCQRTIASQRPE